VGTPGQREARPLRAASPAGPGVIAGVLAAGAAPPLVVPRSAAAGAPIPPSLPKTFQAVVRQSGIPTDAAIHTLRHAYATPLVARGGSLRVIQALLGHKSPRTTARSTHLTSPALDLTPATMSALLAALSALRERPCRR